MEENLLFNEDIKSRYTNRLYRTCYDMKNEQKLGDIKMATCLNLRPRNNFQILENLMVKKRPNNNNQLVELIDIHKKRPQYSSDYKKLLVLKQKIENSFRTKNKNKSLDKSTLIDLNKSSSSSVINSSVINVKSASNKEAKDSEKISKHLLVGSSSSSSNINNNGTGLIKYLGIRKKQQKIIEQLENLKEKDLRRNLSKQVNATRVKNKFNFESFEDECLDSNEVSINSYQQTTTNTRSHYDLDCLKSICDTNKVYLKNLYKNFDIPILYCDSETQFNKTKTDLIDESEECDLVEVVLEDTNKKPPFLKMNPIQFNYKNVRQPRSLLNQHSSKIKKPHWVNIATVGKLNDIKKPYQNTSPNRKITSHLIAQKPEPSLIFVSTFSSFSSLSEYLKIKKPLESNESTTEQQQQQIGGRKTSRKSLNKIHSEEIYSECSRIKSKSTVSSPLPNYSQSIPDEFGGGGDDDTRRKSSFSDLTSTQCKLPDLISSPKVYVLNKNSQTQTAQQQKTKQSFITQTQVYKKLSELQRQNTFEYLKFVSVKNLKENNHENNYISNNNKKIKNNNKKNLDNGKFEAPKISKKILLRENSAIHEKQRELNGKKENKIISYDTKDDDYDYFRATSLSFNDDDDEMDELKIQDDDDGDYDNDDDEEEEEEDDDENQEPDFVITQNSKADQISESNATTTNTNADNIDLDEDLEPKLGKSQSLCTHILTSSSQLRDFFQYSSTTTTTNSTKSLNLILKNNLQFKEALDFMYNQKQVRKLHQKVLEKLEKQRSSTDIRLINFISSNLYTTRSNFDCYKFYERSKTSSLLQSLRHKLYDQITMINHKI
ncbi:unnamed protein product [Brachionus calyciflorus]|uniref:Uncharacterized protein n=1 Tax=Brachionus calyciflorus TaxID=104777 RepID=A0A813QFC5_9BILA|nr:unnamed protein product [Brachionus calyciflorus]